MKIPRSTVSRTLEVDNRYPYHSTPFQGLSSSDLGHDYNSIDGTHTHRCERTRSFQERYGEAMFAKGELFDFHSNVRDCENLRYKTRAEIFFHFIIDNVIHRDLDSILVRFYDNVEEYIYK